MRSLPSGLGVLSTVLVLGTMVEVELDDASMFGVVADLIGDTGREERDELAAAEGCWTEVCMVEK